MTNNLTIEDGVSTEKETTRGILHVVVGDHDWVPTSDEFKEIGELFKKALDEDPNNSVIVTRTGISATYITMEGNTPIKVIVEEKKEEE